MTSDKPCEAPRPRARPAWIRNEPPRHVRRRRTVRPLAQHAGHLQPRRDRKPRGAVPWVAPELSAAGREWAKSCLNVIAVETGCASERVTASFRCRQEAVVLTSGGITMIHAQKSRLVCKYFRGGGVWPFGRP